MAKPKPQSLSDLVKSSSVDESSTSEEDISTVVKSAPTASVGQGGAKIESQQTKAKRGSIYLHANVHEVFREIAFIERTSFQALAMEGLNLILKSRGKPTIEELEKADTINK